MCAWSTTRSPSWSTRNGRWLAIARPSPPTVTRVANGCARMSATSSPRSVSAKCAGVYMMSHRVPRPVRWHKDQAREAAWALARGGRSMLSVTSTPCAPFRHAGAPRARPGRGGPRLAPGVVGRIPSVAFTIREQRPRARHRDRRLPAALPPDADRARAAAGIDRQLRPGRPAAVRRGDAAQVLRRSAARGCARWRWSRVSARRSSRAAGRSRATAR